MEKRSQLGTQTNFQSQQPPVVAASSAKKPAQQPVPAAEAPQARSRNNNGGIKKSNSQSNSQNNGTGTFNDNDTFNRHYNKELRVSKDEIPIVLSELNDSAFQFIKREQYEKALNLLQKAYGIMDVVDFNLCRRDKFNLFMLFHNMALCYQKMQMLEECASCIEQALEYIPMDQFNLQEKSISNRMRKLQMMGKLKLQYCAILSQVHRHKDALEQAKEGVRIGHQLLNDLRQLCEFYIKREDIESSSLLQNNNGSIMNTRNGVNQHNESADVNYGGGSYHTQRQQKKANSSRNRSFCHFLSQQEAYYSEIFQSQQYQQQQQHHSSSSQLKQENSVQNLSSFYSMNYLEESMSYLERTARKLLPILIELKKRMIPEKNITETIRKFNGRGKPDTLESFHDDEANDIGESDESILKKQAADMKNILGYLNQGEWTTALSIGSIMQLQPFLMKDLLEQGKNELEMTRDSFIAKVSLLAVAYFCYSTEIRFILQMKEDPTYDPAIKQKESEYWHAKALEIACTFLPGECPLLNHINLSYQKHFAPVKQTINEEEAVIDDLKVIKPLNGIDNPKFQPIIRQIQNIQIAITPYQMTPVNQITNQYLSQWASFNEYQEQMQTSSNHNVSSFKMMQHIKSKSGDSRSTDFAKQITGNSLKGQATQKTPQETKLEDDDLKKFEQLLDKLVKDGRVDKNELFRKFKLTLQQEGPSSSVIENVLEEGESSQFNDVLLDDQILGEESQHDEEDQIATEAQHQGNIQTNLYKFRNKDLSSHERPKTTNGVHRTNTNSITDQINEMNSFLSKDSNPKGPSHNMKQAEDPKKRSSRPLSGGLQKVKQDNQRSRINKMNPNLSMYEKFGSGVSPEKNSQVGKTTVTSGSNSQFAFMNSVSSNLGPQKPQPYANMGANQPTSIALSAKIGASAAAGGGSDKKAGGSEQNLQAYEELKKRLLNEYKKLTQNKKSFDDQVRDKYKSLKQRGASGKKSSTAHTMPASTQQVLQQMQAQSSSTSGQPGSSQYNPQQLSPKHHLNVYKPTFIINNSFSNESTTQGPTAGVGGTQQNKDIEMIDQISKKYRPQSKQGPPQQLQPSLQPQQPSYISQLQQQQQQIQPASGNGSMIMGGSSRQGSQSIGPSFSQGANNSSSLNQQYFNHQQLANNQQLLGLIMNQEKKATGSSSSGGTKKGSSKTHHQHSQASQDLNIVKQFLNEKSSAGFSGSSNQNIQGKQQINKSMGYPSSQPPLQQQPGPRDMIGPQSHQYQYQTQLQQQKILQQHTGSSIGAEVSKRSGSSHGGAGSSSLHKKPLEPSTIQQNALLIGKQQVPAIEKHKKKLNY